MLYYSQLFCTFVKRNAHQSTMETEKKPFEGKDAEILFSRTIKAGQRIYYIDVKQNRKGEMYLSITESKKMLSGTPEMPQVSYEKHKIFLFQEDFGKFEDAFREALNFVKDEQGEAPERGESDDAIKLDLDF